MVPRGRGTVANQNKASICKCVNFIIYCRRQGEGEREREEERRVGEGVGSFTCAPLKLAGSQWQKRQSCVCVWIVYVGQQVVCATRKKLFSFYFRLGSSAALTPPPLLFAYRSFPLYGFMCF